LLYTLCDISVKYSGIRTVCDISIAPFGSHEIHCVIQEKQWENNCWKLINVLAVYFQC